MATNPAAQRIPQPQHAAAYQQQQQQQQQQQMSQNPLAEDQKKLQDILDALTFIGNIREDINIILDNVGKANSSNNYDAILSAKKSNLQQENQASGEQADQQANNADANDRFISMDQQQQQFFEKTDTKYLQERVTDINKNLSDLDKVIKELTPVNFINIYDFNSILLDQIDERANVSGAKLINSYKWWVKMQENITCTTLMPYKRYTQTYKEKKSPTYRSYSIKQTKKEEIEKLAATHLANNEIKVVSAQKTENQFVLDIIMPQLFKFVILLFDSSVEKVQVRQLDSRILKIYGTSKPSDEICYIDSEHKYLPNVFQRLEENCLFACLYFRTEHGINHFRFLLNWLKNFTNLFNAKCVKCEKHLFNGVPPTWRDLKTFEAYHDECRM